MSDLTTKKKAYSYDSKCMDLALHFLPHEFDGRTEQARALAQAIQDCVENHFLLIEKSYD